MASTKRKICVVTTTRADYSRLRTLLFALRKRNDVELSICVAGSHLLSTYGHTIDEIERDGFIISYRIYTEVDGRVLSTMTKSTGLAIIEFSSFFENQRPDLVVVHGDRFEAFAAATAASMMNIHVAHLQGGEITGTIDEHLRHAITKLSHFHFASDELSASRIKSLGEKPEHVFATGCPSVDELLSGPSYTFQELKEALDPKIKKKEWLAALDDNFLLLVQHPVTTEFEQSGSDMEETLAALAEFPNSVLALWPNIDAGSESIVKHMKEFERAHDEKVSIVDSLPLADFINVMRHARVIVGNSSSGVREACYFGVPTVNIGSRQSGRLRTKNVTDVPGERAAIVQAIKDILNGPRRHDPVYPYGKEGAGERIAELLATLPLDSAQKRLVSE